MVIIVKFSSVMYLRLSQAPEKDLLLSEIKIQNLVVLRVSLLFVKKKTIHFLKVNFHKFTPSFFSSVRGMLLLLCDLIVVGGCYKSNFL